MRRELGFNKTSSIEKPQRASAKHSILNIILNYAKFRQEIRQKANLSQKRVTAFPWKIVFALQKYSTLQRFATIHYFY